MTNPITPPPELVEQWFFSAKVMPVDQWVTDVATQAANWGANQELDACCKDIFEIIAGVYADRVIDDWDQFVELLRDGRRPQPPSLKEQAFDALHGIHDQGPPPSKSPSSAAPWSNSMAESLDKVDSLLWLIFFFGFLVGLFVGSIR